MASIEGIASLTRKLQLRVRKIGPTRTSVVTGYSTNYALVVHEDMTAFHPVGQAKYLEEPFRRLAPELKRQIAADVARGLTVEEALLRAGYKIQRESQQLVPVDSGVLRASAFTEVDRPLV